MTFSQSSFNKFIIDNGIIGFFEQPIKLKSGRITNWYVNWRIVVEDVFLLERLSFHLIDFTKDKINNGSIAMPDCFYGVPEGATKLGILTQYLWAKSSNNFSQGSHVIPMGRAKAKDHGAPKDKYYVGMPKGKTIVIEDVTTTGGSLIETVDKLIESDVDVIAAFGLTHRMELRDDRTRVVDEIAKRKSKSGPVKYLSLSNAVDLLPLVIEKIKPSTEVRNSIVNEFIEHGEKGLSL